MDKSWKEKVKELENGIDSAILKSSNKDILEVMKELLADTKIQNSIKEYYDKTIREN